ncbi:MAG TPA: DUF4157 domain-containing protein [Kofleriaceae bacterium]|nr:DUF4157 domain-containing protein [Kofleriaceae bacterium]
MIDRPTGSRADGFGGRHEDDAPALDRPYGPRSLGATTDGLVQRRADDPAATSDPAAVQAAAAHGTGGAATALPHLDAIQRSFGRHDVGGVQAHVDGAARDGARSMGAEAFTTGDHVAFAGAPSLHTAAHEAAHVVQQRAGVYAKGGVGEAGDPLEQHADAVADRVVRGESAETLLDDHAGDRSAPAGGAVQRKIRVDAIDDGKVFDPDIDHVSSHWGLNEADKHVYREWLKDGDDHHFATKELFVKAVKAAVKPKTRAFGEMFVGLAGKLNISPAWLEQILTEPELTLDTFKLSTPKEVLEIVNFGREEEDHLKEDDLGKMTVQALLDLMLKSGKVTQSCGQTSSLVHSVLAPNSYASDKPVGGNVSALRTSILEANKKSQQELQHYYCRVEGGGHSFTVECFNDQVTLYQSFFNVYAMAKDLGRGKQYTLERFLELLALAVKPVNDKIPSDIGQARTELFSCNPMAFHPDGEFRTTIFKQESGAEGRLSDKKEKKQGAWDDVLDEPATDHMKKPKVVERPDKGTKFAVSFHDDRFLLYDDGYSAVAWEDLADGDYIARYNDAFSLSVIISNVSKEKKTCTITIDE